MEHLTGPRYLGLMVAILLVVGEHVTSSNNLRNLVIPDKKLHDGTLTNADRILYLATHNEDRREINTNATLKQPSAGGMKRMYWSAAIEASAIAWSRFLAKDYKGLKHGQSAIIDLPKFKQMLNITTKYTPWIGQNLFVQGITSGKSTTKAFFGEYHYYNYENLECKPNEVCGHYTQVVWESTTHLGCGYAGYIIPNHFPYYVHACNYFPGGNYDGVHPYRRGQTCELCHNYTMDGFTECDEDLCTPKERCSPVTECKVTDFVYCLCDESEYKKIVSELLAADGVKLRPASPFFYVFFICILSILKAMR